MYTTEIDKSPTILTPPFSAVVVVPVVPRAVPSAVVVVTVHGITFAFPTLHIECLYWEAALLCD